MTLTFYLVCFTHSEKPDAKSLFNRLLLINHLTGGSIYDLFQVPSLTAYYCLSVGQHPWVYNATVIRLYLNLCGAQRG